MELLHYVWVTHAVALAAGARGKSILVEGYLETGLKERNHDSCDKCGSDKGEEREYLRSNRKLEYKDVSWKSRQSGQSENTWGKKAG